MSDLAPYLRHLPDCSAWAPVSVALASPTTEALPCNCGLRAVLEGVGARQEWHADVTTTQDSPQWEDCKICGGGHWTKDHDALEGDALLIRQWPSGPVLRRLVAGIENLPRHTSPDGEETWVEWDALRGLISKVTNG